MWYIIVIVVSIIWVGFFVWVRMDYKRRKAESVKKKARPPFRSEEGLEGYEKPLEDCHSPTIDFDDAE